MLTEKRSRNKTNTKYEHKQAGRVTIARPGSSKVDRDKMTQLRTRVCAKAARVRESDP